MNPLALGSGDVDPTRRVFDPRRDASSRVVVACASRRRRSCAVRRSSRARGREAVAVVGAREEWERARARPWRRGRGRVVR